MEPLLGLAVAAAQALSLSVFAAPHQGTGSTASVLIGVEADGAAGQPLRLDYEISGGPSSIVPRAVTLAPDGGEPDKARPAGTARALTRHALTPGTYQLRITATDAGGRATLVTRNLDVPNLAPGLVRLAMSDALLTASGVTGPTHTDVEDDGALPVLGLPPTTRRTFSQDEKLEVHVEFYEQPSELEFDTQLKVTTRLLAEDGTVVFETSDTGSSEALTGSRWGYEHSTLVPIATAAPGRYVVEVIGETMYDVAASAARSIPITIVATPSGNNR